MLNFEDLPDEVVLKILRYSEIKDLIVYSKVSKRIRKISHDSTLWTPGGINPLHEAARNGHVEVCKHILRHVKDKNPINTNGETLLHTVAKLGKWGKNNHLYNHLYLDVYKCIAETVEDKNPIDKNGATPLSITRNPYIYNYIHRIEKFFDKKQKNETDSTSKYFPFTLRRWF